MRAFFCLLSLQLLLSQPVYNQNFKVEKLPAIINSPYDEISPVPTRDGKTLFFTRVGYPEFNHTLFIDSTNQATTPAAEYLKILSEVYTQIAGYPVRNPISSGFNQDVWSVQVTDSNVITDVVHPNYPLNNALPNSLVAITPDPNAFYIINQFKNNGDMDRGFSIIRQIQDSTWSFPEPITIKDYYTITSDVSLTMSFDGKILILSATRFDSRDMDLYVCFRDGNRQWTAPRHMGNTINSDKRETTPFLSEDHTTLFFSSNRWNTSGGNDIFMSKRLDSTWTKWEEPIRLTEPINSKFDESQPYFNMSSGYLYFTSKRDGNSDIFRVKIAPPQPTEIIVNGRILNSKTKQLITNATVWYGTPNNPANFIEAPDGYFTLKITKGIPTELNASKIGMRGITLPLEFRRDYYYFKDQEIELLLEPLNENSTIQLNAIYFQQSKSTILPESHQELDRLLRLLNENPSLKIRIEGHTDNLGNPADLKALSEKRAEAIQAWLIDHNINPDRLESIGFGADKPISTGETETERAKNRRVEIRIIKL